MPWSDDLALLNSAVIDTDHGLGELVSLADGTQIRALFALNNPEGWGLGGGVQDMLDAQPQPYLQLTEAAAAEHSAYLTAQMPITARGVGYMITEPGEPDGHGLVRYTLMSRQPQDEAGSGAGDWRWR